MNKAWYKFIEDIDEAKIKLDFQDGEECFYRGHSNREWKVLPSLLRHAKNANLKAYDIRALEADLFFEFQSRAQSLHLQNLSDWEVLQFMRHHGVATRLLDWTETLGVALFFAVHGIAKDSKPCIWLLNPYKLNEHEKSWFTRDLISPKYRGKKDDFWDYSEYMTDFVKPYSFGWKHPIALYPVQRSARLQSQRGYFTIHGDYVRPLEDIDSSSVCRLDIAEEIIPEIKKFLELAGINDYTMFPDLDGLARDLHRKYNIS
jgi:L-rhamnose mutarotase